MHAPFLSYITFNRLGLTARNLQALLDTPEIFEMHIIDSNSQDGTWEFLNSLNDPRIKSLIRLPLNYGPIYPLNLNLSKRKPEQYFIAIDSDVRILTKKWFSIFLEVFEAFPEAGLLGVRRGDPYPAYYPPVIPRTNDTIHYLQLKNGNFDAPLDFVPGCLQVLRPELIAQIGYWNEECGYGDSELSARVNHFTDYKAGFVDSVQTTMTQSILCSECTARKWCSLNTSNTTCFNIWQNKHINEIAVKRFRIKFLSVCRELNEKKRTAFAASQFDSDTTEKYVYHRDWAMDCFQYYVDNTN